MPINALFKVDWELIQLNIYFTHFTSNYFTSLQNHFTNFQDNL